MMSPRVFLFAVIAVVVCQSLAIAGMLVTHNNRLNAGREVVIRSAFVDPRSLFRGHYVIINLQPGDLTKSKIEADGPFKYRETVFVELVKTDGIYWEARRLSHKLPEGTDHPVIKGVVLSDPKDASRPYRLQFPFNRYFADRSRARALEKIQRDQRLGVVLALDKHGNGLIKGLMVEGQLVYDERVF